MLRNRSFRTKMLAITLAPIVVLAVFAALLIRPQIGAAGAASENQRSARFVQRTVALVAVLQDERDISAWWAAGRGPAVSDELAKVRLATDEETKKFLGTASQTPKSMASAWDTSSKAVGELESIRTDVDSGTLNASAVLDAYTARIDALLDSTRALAEKSSSVALSRRATALSDLVYSRDNLSRLRGAMVAKLETKSITAADFRTLVGYFDNSESGIARFRENISEADGQLLDTAMNSSRVRQSADTLERIVFETFGNGSTTVRAEDWMASQVDLLGELDRFTEEGFARYDVDSGEASKSASRTALLLALAALISGGVTSAVALVLARSVTRRLTSMAEQARIISTEKLPEVLAALRNPTAEQVSGALPTVRADADDELGVMADSFNKVLHTSVKTSLEHSQQRAQTVTNMLVNLGRRNQSLIDRQLKIMDRLEAKEEDPDTLEALYEVDHLVTRMRRNAENLLVLSGQKQARTWAKPVSLYDVLRSAASEVSDLNRAVIGDVKADLIMSGPFAVDVSHLLAELVENATRYSPKTTAVALSVREEIDESVSVIIADTGVGMSDEEFEVANERLAHPPEIDELVTDRVGFQVVGRLGRKLGIDVRVGPNHGGGVAATVTLPRALFEGEKGDAKRNDRSASAAPNSVGSMTSARNQAPTSSTPMVGSQKVGLRATDPAAVRAPQPEPAAQPAQSLPSRPAAPPVVAPVAPSPAPVARLADPADPTAKRLTPSEAVLMDLARGMANDGAASRSTAAPAAEAKPLPTRSPAQPAVQQPGVQPEPIVAARTELPPTPAAASDDLPKRGRKTGSEVQREGFGRLPEAPAPVEAKPVKGKASTFAAFQQAKERVAQETGATTSSASDLAAASEPTTPVAPAAPAKITAPVASNAGPAATYPSGSVETIADATPSSEADGGLIQRRPGKIFSDAAQAADSGAFKRLGNGNEERAVDSVPASSRFAALSRLQRGVTTARQSDSPESPTNLSSQTSDTQTSEQGDLK